VSVGGAGSPTSDSGTEPGLIRAIGTRDLAANIINLVVGAGIFVLPALVFAEIGAASFLAYLVCALAIGLVFLCFAEIGSRVTTSGGAYAYVEAAENDFRWLGGQLGLQATVNTASIQLPPEVYAKLGAHPQPSGTAAPVKTSAPAPDTAAVQRVFEYFRRGEAGPVLGHLVPCLELDLAKKSPSRYECKTPVAGPVKLGTEVFAWTDWLVPRDMRGAVEIQIVKDEQVRLSKKIKLIGKPRSPIVPATVAARLTQEGIYTFRVKVDGQVVSEISVETRK